MSHLTIKTITIVILFQIWESQINAQQISLGVQGPPFDTSKCALPSALVSEIQSYQTAADTIFNAATQKPFKRKSYNQLKYISDIFGPRPSGTPALEKVIDYVLEEMRADGRVNVRAEKVLVSRVRRGKMVAKMLKPRIQELGITATGYSAATFGLTAYIFVCPSKEYLMANLDKVRGKIVVFDYFVLSLEQDEFVLAEQAGALAVISRVLVTFSIYSIAVRAGSESLRIPAIFMTNEDMDLIRRLNRRGIPIEIYLKVINAVTPALSRNIMGDLPGKSKSNEFVLISGHLDSWFSQGSQDDGVGIVLSLQVPKLLKQLNLIPKRTVRTALFTSEELGVLGSELYAQAHANELSRYSAVIEADWGCFEASGFYFPKPFTQFGCILNEIMKLQLKTVGAKILNITGNTLSEISTDIYSFSRRGIPGANLIGDDEMGRYFWYHHTLADTMSVVNSDQLDRCLALAATTVYILADLKDMVPRN